MLTLETTLHVAGLRAAAAYAFFLHPTDEQYRRWWPGTHLRFHALHRPPGVGPVGDRVSMDEYIGSRRVRLQGEVVEAVPGARLVWQLRKGVRLPAWLRLDLADDATGVTLQHTLRAGFAGPGRVLDPLLRRYLSAGFARDLDEHVRTEFPKLRDLLAGEATAVRPAAAVPGAPGRG
jgi:uncharacterized protein YndB with AHSA1/START domain